MQWDDILGFAVVIALIIIPALAISARLALRPIVEAIIRLREGYAALAPGDGARMASIEEELRQLRGAVEELTRAARFDKQLPTPDHENAPRLPGAAS